MPRIGNNIYKRKDGRWEGRYRKGRNESGKIIYGYVFARTFTDVKKRLISKQNEVPKQTMSSTTLSTIAEQWLSVKRLKVKPSTYAEYEATVNLHILPPFGDLKVEQFTTEMLHAFTREKLIGGRTDGEGGLSPSTVRIILTILKGMLDYAVTENMIDKPVHITYPTKRQKNIRVLTRSEQAALQQVLLKDTTIYKMGILLCLYTGLRVGEVCGLRCEDFSTEADKVSVCRTLRRVKDENDSYKTKLIVGTPKSKTSIREIPIPEFLSLILRDFIHDKDDYFLSTDEHALTEPRTIQNHFKQLVKSAGIADANFHCLRHTFSTRCMEANIDIKTISEMLGHSSVSFTLNQYVHSSYEQKRKSMDKLEQYLNL